MPRLPAVLAAMFAAQLAYPVHDVDVFWQLKLGEITLARGLPTHEPLLAGREAEPFAAVCWLAQAAYALARQLGGWPLLRLLDSGLWLGGFALAALSARRSGAGRVAVAVALAVGWGTALPCASVRPQSFAVFAFGLLIVLTRSRWPARRAVPLGAALLVVWQNCHPSAAVAAAYLGAGAAAEWGLYWLGRAPRPSLTRLLLTPLAAAATFATPAGLDALRLAADNRARCTSELLRIQEWLPIWDTFPTGGRVTSALGLLIAAAVVVWKRRRVRMTDLLPALAFTVLAAGTFRFILFWGVAAVPLLAHCLTPDASPHRDETYRRRRAALLFALAALVTLPRHFAADFPFAGAAALAEAGPGGVAYTNKFWAGFLVDAGHPRWRVTHDGRYYLSTQAELEEYAAAAAGEVPLEAIEAKHRPAAFFLRPGDDDGLIGLLRASPRWRSLHEDGDSVAFVPR